MLIKLRKLTFKSVIGFGNFKDLTVQDLVNLNRHKDLVNMYYKLGNIDFSEDVKEHMCITEKRVIQKPGKDLTAYKWFLHDILHDVIEKHATAKLGIPMLRKEATYQKKRKQIALDIGDRVVCSKMRNRNKNQW